MALTNVDPDNSRIWGSDDDYVAVADLDEVFSTPNSIGKAATAPFEEVGWLAPEGLTLTPTDEVSKLKGFQGGRVIRTVITSSETSFQFQALESTLLTMGLALGLKQGSTSNDVTKHTLPGARVVEARQFLIGLFDGDVKWLLHVPHGEITERQAISLGRENITGYTLTVEIIGDAYLYTEDDEALGGTGGGGD